MDFKEVTQRKAAIIAANAPLHEQLGLNAKEKIQPGDHFMRFSTNKGSCSILDVFAQGTPATNGQQAMSMCDTIGIASAS